MASAEARARWLRNANRCFVQEDYVGASKTSSFPSSSSKSESDGSPGDAAKRSDLPPDTKWWLHLQSNCSQQKMFSQGQLDAFEKDVAVSSTASLNPTAKLSEERKFIDVYSTKIYAKDSAASILDQPWEAFTASMENVEHVRIQDLEAAISDTLQKNPMNKDIGKFWYADDHLVDLDPYNFLASEQPNKLSSEMESHWIGVEKTEPWWRTADIDDLASLVSNKSLEQFENCDLPHPQNKHTQGFEQDKGLASLDQKAEKEMSNLADSMMRTPPSISMGKAQCNPGVVGYSPRGSDRSFRRNIGCSTTKADAEETLQTPSSDLSKAQLLEALCHSQTRAREAEKAAQQAYDEKEHIIKLFFRQASQLFAYKLWLQILQLETLCLQLRNKKGQPIYTHFPAFVPWVPSQARQPRNGRCKAPKRKPGLPIYRISKCAVAFVMGLSLAGTGLLLGWTMGWLFPAL